MEFVENHLDLEEYKKLLARHDWFYQYSDDSFVYNAGCNSLQKIGILRKKLDPDYVIWNSIAPTERQVIRKQLLADAIENKTDVEGVSND